MTHRAQQRASSSQIETYGVLPRAVCRTAARGTRTERGCRSLVPESPPALTRDIEGPRQRRGLGGRLNPLPASPGPRRLSPPCPPRASQPPAAPRAPHLPQPLRAHTAAVGPASEGTMATLRPRRPAQPSGHSLPPPGTTGDYAAPSGGATGGSAEPLRRGSTPPSTTGRPTELVWQGKSAPSPAGDERGARQPRCRLQLPAASAARRVRTAALRSRLPPRVATSPVAGPAARGAPGGGVLLPERRAVPARL